MPENRENKEIIVNLLAIDHYGEEMQHIVCMEELSELSKEISKWLRGEDNVEEIAEEIADVMICIQQMCMIHDISKEKVDAIKERKISRTLKRIVEDTEEEDD